jgi:electron transport complex protein RnfC
MALLKSFKGGANVEHHKNTHESTTVIMPIPKIIKIPMLQHIGAVCVPLVKKGDLVKVGQKIADSEAYVSSPIHSSVSGKVIDVKPELYPGGFDVVSIEIETDGLQDVWEEIKPPDKLDKAGMIKAIRESGVVGLGGAGFPTHVKLSPPPGKVIDVLIINGAECEPYITSDYREMIENTDDIIEGIKILMNITGAQKAYIGIESNKPEALKLFSKKAESSGNFEVVPLKTRYPQGAEKQLIFAATKRKVPAGGLPSDIGILVQNINTVSFIARYFKTGMPLIYKRITVDGSAVKSPSNVQVPIGTQLKDIFEFCGGFTENPEKIIMGGPMMGVSQFSLETSVLKQTNAILALNSKDAALPEESVCIRCGRCVFTCPMNLMPLYINASVMLNDYEGAKQYGVMDCIECGCCSYVCPAKRHLVQSIRLSKSKLRKQK